MKTRDNRARMIPPAKRLVLMIALVACILVLGAGGGRALAKESPPKESPLQGDAPQDTNLPLPLSWLLGPNDSLLMEDSSGKVVLAHNKDVLRTPASTFKVFTSLLALEKLGKDFRFKTEIYMDETGNLTVKGYGDPLLISEVLEPLAREIASRMNSCRTIVLDASYFESPLEIPGTGTSANPYDAPVGAFCANFNTVFFDYGTGGQIKSAEPQTPLIPFAEEIISRKKLPNGRVLLTQGDEQTTLYAGHLLRHFLQKHGMTCGEVAMGRAGGKDTLLFTHYSPYSLEQVVEKTLEYSNNFIVNQVFLTVGAQEQGAPATLEKAVNTARDFASTELGIKDLSIAEGSGLSRMNQITAVQMMEVLKKFQPFHTLMHHEKGVWYKTGTLSGIRTLVGYIPEKDSGNLSRFVIFVNTPGRSARKVFKQILTR